MPANRVPEPDRPRIRRGRKPRGRAASSPVIQSIQRAFGILEAVARRGTGMTMAEISRELGLHPSTTFHLLRTVATLGYLRQDGATRQNRLGPKVFRLASSALTEVQLSETAGPLLAEMARETGETSHLAVFDRGEVVVIGKIDGSSPLRLAERIGYPRPAHCTAIGKVLLAHLGDAELKALLADARLEPRTARTITEVPRLEQELAGVRASGYALDDEEFAQGVRCVAAPVRSFTGRVIAAIGLSGPVWRVSAERLPHLVDVVQAMAARLSREPGHADPGAWRRPEPAGGPGGAGRAAPRPAASPSRSGREPERRVRGRPRPRLRHRPVERRLHILEYTGPA